MQRPYVHGSPAPCGLRRGGAIVCIANPTPFLYGRVCRYGSAQLPIRHWIHNHDEDSRIHTGGIEISFCNIKPIPYRVQEAICEGSILTPITLMQSPLATFILIPAVSDPMFVFAMPFPMAILPAVLISIPAPMSVDPKIFMTGCWRNHFNTWGRWTHRRHHDDCRRGESHAWRGHRAGTHSKRQCQGRGCQYESFCHGQSNSRNVKSIAPST